MADNVQETHDLIAFLVSCIRGGESLNTADEARIIRWFKGAAVPERGAPPEKEK